jgi:hypothetical protein
VAEEALHKRLGQEPRPKLQEFEKLELEVMGRWVKSLTPKERKEALNSSNNNMRRLSEELKPESVLKREKARYKPPKKKETPDKHSGSGD